jgi:hypothetical protein
MRTKIISKKQVIVIFIFLSPLLFFGYTADDRQHVLMHFLSHEKGVWNNLESIVNDVVNMQRFFPMHIILYSTLFKMFDYGNSWIYHGGQIILNILAYISFGRWIKSYFNIKVDGLVLMLFLTTIQFRVTYSDPVVSYFGVMQILAIAQFEGLIFLKEYIERGNNLNKKKWIILLIIQLLLYEMTLFLLPLAAYYLYLNRKLNHRRCILACTEGITLVGIYLAIYIYIKKINEISYSGTSLSLDMEKIIGTTIIEAFGSLPLSYAGYIFAQKLYYNGILVWGIYGILLAVLVIAIISREKLKGRESGNLRFLQYGALIWMSSALSIAFSERYQKEMSLGLTYIVSYMQNYGYIMVVYYFLHRFEAKKIIIGICALTFMFNILMLNEVDKIDGSKRIAMEVLTDANINKNFNYTTLILNENIMQEEDKFKKNVGHQIEEIFYIKVNELDGKRIDIKHDKVGIAIAQKERYGKTTLIVGGYDWGENKIYEANIYTKNLIVAEEAKDKYHGVIRTKQSDVNGDIFIVSIRDHVKIDENIKGKFR